MSVILTVEREIVPGVQGDITRLLRELRSAATRQSGFISGQTVIDPRSPTCFMTISEWSSINAWENWEKNPVRSSIVEQIGALLQVNPKQRLWVHDEDAPPGAI